jgi:acetyl-CoA acetyltransferase
MAPRKVYVIGVGMTNFVKPKSEAGEGPHFPDLGKEAFQRALQDACVSTKDIEQAFVGNMFANGSAQRSLYGAGLTGIPMHNVHNACATGSNALFLARNAVAGGLNECALALGVEKMRPGSLGGGKPTGEPTSLDVHYYILNTKFPMTKSPPMAQFFGAAAREYMQLYPNCTPKHFAMIGEKSHRHSVNNPYSQFRDPATLDEVLKSPEIFAPLTKLQCSPTSDGAACVIVASEDFVIKHGLQGQAIEIAGQSMRTDEPISINTKGIKENPRAIINLIGYPMAAKSAQEAYKQAGITPQDVQVVELHDCFSANELITYEALGLCPEGKAWEMVEKGDNTYGGRVVVNPSGGLISKGHPLGKKNSYLNK